MSNPIVYQVIFGLLFLFFCYLTYMFTKTWRWVHVTIAFFLFVAVIAFCGIAARTVRTHMAWKKMVAELTGQLEQQSEQYDTLLYGDMTQPIEESQSLRSLHAQLGRLLLDRGRVWRNCTPGPPGPGEVTVNTVPPGVAEADAAPNRIAENMILYAFVEYEVPNPDTFGLQPGTRIPGFYLGEFTASAVSDTTVTLQPTMPIPRIAENALGQSDVTWALYETMPVDGHEYFAEDPNHKPALDKPADEEPVFGNMDEPMLRQLFQPFQAQVGETWEGMIEPYLQDGKRGDRDLPEDNVWLKVQFLRAHTELVDSNVDNPLGAVSESQTFFDSQGSANVPLLQRGDEGEAQFKVNDVGVFPLAKGDQLVRDGICEEIEPIFVRSLHNYAYALRSITQQLTSLAQHRNRVQRNTQDVTESNQRTVEQINFREEEKQKLTEDRDKFLYELQKVTEYADTLEQHKAAKLAELSRLYSDNYQLAEELARIERELTEQINRRTLQAIAESGAE